MIVEDQNVSDCFATDRERPRHDGENSFLSSRRCMPRRVRSNNHHSFLKGAKIDISQKFGESLNR